jgi:hypothetical protein
VTHQALAYAWLTFRKRTTPGWSGAGLPLRRSSGITNVKTFWIIAWRGTEERLASLADAIDRQEQLDAQGIEAELFEVAGGERRLLG